MKGDMYLARSSDDGIWKRAEYGSAVTSLFKYEPGMDVNASILLKSVNR